jgi:hypothetical protein
VGGVPITIIVYYSPLAKCGSLDFNKKVQRWERLPSFPDSGGAIQLQKLHGRELRLGRRERMSDGMSDAGKNARTDARMSERMPDGMSDHCQFECPIECQIECQNIKYM